jgi:hypothetical protein
VKPVDCEFESEILAAVLQDRWPARVDAGLREHVAACEICAEVAAIAGAIDNDRQEMRAQASVPDSGRVWWIAQMRARREAAQTAGRPITVAQVIACACAMGLLGACFGATSAWFQAALHRGLSSLSALRLQTLLPTFLAFVAGHGALFLAMAAILLVIPAAVYLTLLRE